jgi:5,10-methenyltetrahydromethanopterin hydrogenase
MLISLVFVAMFDKKTLAQPVVSSDIKVPLVVVNGDTITTYDLELELEIMKKMNQQEVDLTTYEPEQVLRRLIQNQMILHEGYRLEIQNNTSVSNQVREFVRTKAITTLLDSVSLSVQADSTELREARRKAVVS